MKKLIRGALALLILSSALLAVPSSVSAQQASNPNAGLVVSKDRLFIDEGSSKTFTVKLATQPRIVDLETDIRIYSTVAVAMKPDDATIATIATANASPDDDGWLNLTFTRDNWNVAQTVTVTTVSDDDRTDEMTGIDFSTGSADTDYYDLDHDLKVVALETERDDGTPTSVSASRQWSVFNQKWAVRVSFSGFDEGHNNVYRRNITRGDTNFVHIHADYIMDYQPWRSSWTDADVRPGINLYRVGLGDWRDGVDALTTSRTVAAYFYPAGGA